MAKVIPVPLLSLFNGVELETMACGSPEIPLSLLQSVSSNALSSIYCYVMCTAAGIFWDDVQLHPCSNAKQFQSSILFNSSIRLCTVIWIMPTLILWCIYEIMILYLSALTQVATYKGVESSAPLIQWFWQVMEEFSNVERSLFLRFVWGRTRLPRTVADFRGRDFVLQVTMNYPNSLNTPSSTFDYLNCCSL